MALDRNRYLRVMTLILSLPVFFSLISGCVTERSDILGSLPVLISASVNSNPKIDGLASDAVWQEATALKIKTTGGPEVTMKSIHTDNRIYVLATWADATKDDVDEIWDFDGTTWRTGTIDDAFALFWNEDGAIPGFDEKGCQAVCHNEDADESKWRMFLTSIDQKKMADIWDISLGISNIRGSVNDYVFAVDPAYQKNPMNNELVLIRQHDAFTNRAPIVPNYWIDPADGQKKPRYQYKDGLTVDSTPYPFVYEVEEIRDYTLFKPGARLPYMIFYPFGMKWGGSRDDITGKAVWNKGKWTVEMARKLKTGHKDDIDFAPADGKSHVYTFAVAVFDRTIIGHKTSKPVRFEIE